MATSKFSQARLADVIIGPVFSEKATRVGELANPQLALEVQLKATKPEIKAAAELMFKTRVKSVQIVRNKARKLSRGHRGTVGQTKNRKKAYLCLMPGEDVNFMEGVV